MACPPASSLLPHHIGSSSSGNSSEAVLQQTGLLESSPGAERIEVAQRVLKAITPSSLERPVALDCSISQLRLPTIKTLVEDLEKRPWHQAIPFSCALCCVDVPGYLPRGETPEERAQADALDQQLLLEAVRVNNAMFANLLTLLDEEKCEGYIVHILLPSGTKVSARGDVHGDLATVLAKLRLLQQIGILDENFRCLKGARVVFDGDLIDRSVNDITTLLLLLLLRIENRGDVELIRGNHEAIDIQAMYSNESLYFLEHETEFKNFYRTMPLAGCIAGIPKEHKIPHYMHISHGGLSVAVDLDPLFQSKADLLLIPAQPTNSARMSGLVQSPNPKIKSSFAMLEEFMPPEYRAWISYQWDDVAEDFVDTGRNMPGASALIPSVFEDYAEVNSSPSGKIKWYVRAHNHVWAEWCVWSKKLAEKNENLRGKVYITTLSTGTKGSFYSSPASVIPFQIKQGLVLTVGEEIKTWKKQVICWDGSNPAYLSKEYALYDRTFSEKKRS